MTRQNQLKKRIEIYEDAVERIEGHGFIKLMSGEAVGDTDEKWCEFLRERLWDKSNETRQTPHARIARRALKEANLLWTSQK